MSSFGPNRTGTRDDGWIFSSKGLNTSLKRCFKSGQSEWQIFGPKPVLVSHEPSSLGFTEKLHVSPLCKLGKQHAIYPQTYLLDWIRCSPLEARMLLQLQFPFHFAQNKKIPIKVSERKSNSISKHRILIQSLLMLFGRILLRNPLF